MVMLFSVVQKYSANKVFKALNSDIMQYFKSSEKNFLYVFWRYFNSVNTSLKRHSIPLPYTSVLHDVLSITIKFVKPFLDSQLCSSSPLVELSSIISLPGSSRQQTHSDVPFSEHNALISGFVALSKITIESGPTCVYLGTHTKAFHSKIGAQKPLSTYYAADGCYDSLYNDENLRQNDMEDEESLEVNTADIESRNILLNIGDVLLFDTRLFHYGRENVSEFPRALLGFSFQECNPWGHVTKINGFTYHCHRSIKVIFVPR